MSADAAVLAAVSALAQSPLRPGILDDISGIATVAQLRKQVSHVTRDEKPEKMSGGKIKKRQNNKKKEQNPTCRAAPPPPGPADTRHLVSIYPLASPPRYRHRASFRFTRGKNPLLSHEHTPC